MTTGTALIIVDLQIDFMAGTLAVPDAHAVVDPIREAAGHVEYVVFTRDWHPANHVSFAAEPQFVDKSWPVHCVQQTVGAMIHPETLARYPDAPIFNKGQVQWQEAYSGFDGHTCDERGQAVELSEWLQSRGVYRVIVTGLATDYCVKATAVDAVAHGFETTLLAEAVRGVSPVTSLVAAGEMSDEGVWITTLDKALTVGI